MAQTGSRTSVVTRPSSRTTNSAVHQGCSAICRNRQQQQGQQLPDACAAHSAECTDAGLVTYPAERCAPCMHALLLPVLFLCRLGNVHRDIVRADGVATPLIRLCAAAHALPARKHGLVLLRSKGVFFRT